VLFYVTKFFKSKENKFENADYARKAQKRRADYTCKMLKWKLIQHFPYLLKNEKINI